MPLTYATHELGDSSRDPGPARGFLILWPSGSADVARALSPLSPGCPPSACVPTYDCAIQAAPVSCKRQLDSGGGPSYLEAASS